MRTIFEYRIITIKIRPTEALLNEWGVQGWEFCESKTHTDGRVCILKREIIE